MSGVSGFRFVCIFFFSFTPSSTPFPKCIHHTAASPLSLTLSLPLRVSLSLRWCEMMEEAADLRRKMRLCANMMMNKALATGWRLWCEAVQDARDERTAHEELVGKAVRTMMNRQLAGAWDW